MSLATSALILTGSGSGSGVGFNPNPDPNQLPGFSVLQKLTDGIEGWALIAALVGVVVGAILWGCTQRTLTKPTRRRCRSGGLLLLGWCWWAPG
jgi:hypothetical protein